MEIAWGVTATVVGILLTIAFSAVGYAPAEFRLARWCLIISALALGGTDIVWQFTTKMPWWWRTIVGASVGSLIFVGLPETLRWVSRRQQQITPVTPPVANTLPISEIDTTPPTLMELFKSGFPNTMKVDGASWGLVNKDGHELLKGPSKVYLDFDARTKFIAFYIPRSEYSYESARSLWSQVPPTFAAVEKNIGVQAGYHQNLTDLKDLKFSGRVFLYYEDNFNLRQLADLVDAYKAHGMALDFRGPSFLGDQVIAWHHKHDKK